MILCRRLGLLFSLLLGLSVCVVYACIPSKPPLRMCQTCPDRVCPDGYGCSHGFCLPRLGHQTCTLPKNVHIVLTKQRTSTPIQGCTTGQAAVCFPHGKLCHRGTTRCYNGYWGECSVEYRPKQLGFSCHIGQGECKAEGIWKCGFPEQAQGVYCDAKKIKPQSERCNGKDDDCDGSIDEQLSESCFDGPFAARDVGVCKVGTSTCEQGQWSPCREQVLPVREICNGKDDDCDGSIDESLKRACYRGPPGTAGVGPCKAGIQKCEQGIWTGCQGAIEPKEGQSCVPVLQHTLATSVLDCRASAKSQECDESGQCSQKGEQKTNEVRKLEDQLMVRCRSFHNAQCGAFSAEGLVQREWVQKSAKEGSFSLSIRGFSGSCACNSWCDKGCQGRPGCCLSCSILARHCYAGASYLGYHQFDWKTPLPHTFPMVLDVKSMSGKQPNLHLRIGSKKEFISLQKGMRCLIPIGRIKSELLLIHQASYSCGGSESFQLTLDFRPFRLGDEKLKMCVPS